MRVSLTYVQQKSFTSRTRTGRGGGSKREDEERGTLEEGLAQVEKERARSHSYAFASFVFPPPASLPVRSSTCSSNAPTRRRIDIGADSLASNALRMGPDQRDSFDCGTHQLQLTHQVSHCSAASLSMRTELDGGSAPQIAQAAEARSFCRSHAESKPRRVPVREAEPTGGSHSLSSAPLQRPTQPVSLDSPLQHGGKEGCEEPSGGWKTKWKTRLVPDLTRNQLTRHVTSRRGKSCTSLASWRDDDLPPTPLQPFPLPSLPLARSSRCRTTQAVNRTSGRTQATGAHQAGRQQAESDLRLGLVFQ